MSRETVVAVTIMSFTLAPAISISRSMNHVATTTTSTACSTLVTSNGSSAASCTTSCASSSRSNACLSLDPGRPRSAALVRSLGRPPQRRRDRDVHLVLLVPDDRVEVQPRRSVVADAERAGDDV